MQIARVECLKTKISSIPEGKELIELAEKNTCSIVFDTTLKPHEHGWLDFSEKTIKLNPQLNNKKLLKILVHELRHLWQACTVDFKSIYSTALNGNGTAPLVFMRVTEGDAYAFSEKFMHRLKNTNKTADLSAAFTKFQKGKYAPRYDRQTIIYLKNIETAITEGKFPKAGLSAIFNAASAPQAADENLLKITRNGLDDTAVNYLNHSNYEALASDIIGYIRSDILETTQSLQKSIKNKAAKALKNMP